jgi:hypothetical protein
MAYLSGQHFFWPGVRARIEPFGFATDSPRQLTLGRRSKYGSTFVMEPVE